MKHFEVVCAIIKNDDKYFICKRGPKGECAYKWEFPGGKIEPNETHEMALVREIKEELNTDIKVIKFVSIVNHTYNTFSITMHAYLCELIKGNLELSEHVDKKFILEEEFKDFDFAYADILIINDLINKKF